MSSTHPATFSGTPGGLDNLYQGGHPAARRGALASRAPHSDPAIKDAPPADPAVLRPVSVPDRPLPTDEAAALSRLAALLGSPDTRAVGGGGAGLVLPAPFARIVITPGGPKPARVRLSQAGSICRGDLAALLAHPRWGVTEQIAGRRCVIVGEEDGTLHAYDRSGGAVAVPAAAQVLARLGGSFIIDGAVPAHGPTEGYIAFDYLARHGASLRALPYEERSARLAVAFGEAGLIGQAGATVARLVSTVPGLGLLVPASTAAAKAAVLAEVEAAGGTGIVLRHLDGPSLSGDTRHDLLWPLAGDLDLLLLTSPAWIAAC